MSFGKSFYVAGNINSVYWEMQQRWNDGDTNDGKGVELYINCKANLAPNFWINY